VLFLHIMRLKHVVEIGEHKFQDNVLCLSTGKSEPTYRLAHPGGISENPTTMSDVRSR
jgi:hypothetical protein